MSKETREMVDNLLKSLDIKYRSGEWYRVDDVRKLLHELVDGYNKQIDDISLFTVGRLMHGDEEE